MTPSRRPPPRATPRLRRPPRPPARPRPILSPTRSPSTSTIRSDVRAPHLSLSLLLLAWLCVAVCGCAPCSISWAVCATRSVARCPLSASTSEGSCRSSIERTCDSFRSSLPGLLASCRCCCRCCCCCNCRRCRLGEGRALCLLVSVDTVCR